MFISHHNIVVMLISETNFTGKSYLKLHEYAVYHTKHKAGTALGETAIITKTHHQTSSAKQL
jgi:hypothetical protein